MLFEKDFAFKNEFEQLLSYDKFQDILESLPDDADKGKWSQCIIKLICQAAADYNRRFSEVLKQWQNKLFLVCKSDPEEYCSQRKSVCLEWLRATAAELGPTATKIRTRFISEIKRASETGLLGKVFHGILRRIGSRFHTRTGDVEGCNNQIKGMLKKAQNTTLQVISARVQIGRKTNPIGVGKTWSNKKPYVQKAIDTMVDNFKFIHALQTPEKIESPTPTTMPIRPKKEHTEAHRWSRRRSGLQVP